MADIVPFSGLRYAADAVGDVARVLSPPYDVIGEEQRAELEARHPQNVVRLELPRGEGDARYADGGRLLGAWTAEGFLRADATPAFYVYEQQFTLPQAAGRLHAPRVLRGRSPRAVRAAGGPAAREDAVGAQGGSPQAAARDPHPDLADLRALPRRRRRRRAS